MRNISSWSYQTLVQCVVLQAINQVVLWDKIIQRGDISDLDLSSMNTKYYFWDDGNGLK